ncbi:hypothetical protein GJV26_00045 [Massilia dura]|uniref:Phage capsid protein n=1 Tax=Pseudoduganella dura TaxID=321982 RepID=A0A6I3X3T7_9BURK|nr:GPO family capsid scaffolding protein [Pseudoduganella dura]MUI10887.1 hypothetical protein [Pseudoduganella dura]GGY12702.1 phage capsid scaffolding protein [Pseudoduganella dura]
MHRKRTISLAVAALGALLSIDAHAATATAQALATPEGAALGISAALGLGAFGTTAAHAGQKSRFFRIALEGATTDGRVIEREWLEQMAANYNPNTYGARLNLEHVRGIDPEGMFKAYGDVLALETREEEGGKLGLYAQIEPTADLIALNKKRQKLYTSCEINPAFSDTGEAYLVGLAVTDNPASLGTEMLQFSAQNPAVFKGRKQAPDNLYTAATEADLEMEPAKTPAVTLLSKITGMLKGTQKDASQRFADVSSAVETVAEHVRETDEKVDATVIDLAQLRADFTALTEQLSATPAQPPRPAAKGGAGTITTDC